MAFFSHLCEGPVDNRLLCLHNVWGQLAHVADGQVAQLVDEEGLKVPQKQQRLTGLASPGSATHAVHVLRKQ